MAKRKFSTYSAGPYKVPVRKYASKRARTATSMARAAVVPGLTRSGGSYARYGSAAARLGLMPEKKYFDTSLSFTYDLTAEVPATGQLALIPQGDTASTRDGRQAIIKSIQIRGLMQFAPGAAASGNAIAYTYLVLDTQCNGAAAAVTDVFTSATASGHQLNLDNSSRFRILKKWTHSFQAGAGVTTAYNNVSKQFEYYKSCNIPMNWNSTTGAITEINSNNLFLIAGSTSADDLITFTGTCRLRFVG